MFDNMSTIEILKMAAPFLVMQIGLAIFCLFKLKNDKVKYLPKIVWAIIIILGEAVGPIAYLTIGRERY